MDEFPMVSFQDWCVLFEPWLARGVSSGTSALLMNAMSSKQINVDQLEVGERGAGGRAAPKIRG
jgi:hypothetical protein